MVSPAATLTPSGPLEPQYLLPPIERKSWAQADDCSTSNPERAVTTIAASARTLHCPELA